MKKEITVSDAIKTMEQIKTYVSAVSLDEMTFVIDVLKKLQSDGITDPLNTDFTKAKN